jgi:hypothetical protein
MKIYYAHFIGIYDTKQEQRDIELINNIFKNVDVINPNSKENDKLYKTKGMDLFFDYIKQCDLLVFRGLINGKIPAGVMKEINYAKQNNISVLELPSYIDREMTVDDTRQSLIELGIR